MSVRRKIRRCKCWHHCKRDVLAWRIKSKAPAPDNPHRRDAKLRYAEDINDLMPLEVKRELAFAYYNGLRWWP